MDQDARQHQPRPGVAVEHPVERREAGLVGQAEGAQHGGDGARADRQHGADRERRHGGAGASGEGFQIRPQPRDEAFGKNDGAGHGAPAGALDVDPSTAPCRRDRDGHEWVLRSFVCTR